MHVQLEILYAYIEPHCKLKYWANGLISVLIDTSKSLKAGLSSGDSDQHDTINE